MKKRSIKLLAAAVTLLIAPMVSVADPAGDVDTYHKVMKKKFPEVPMQEYANGVYAIDEIKRANWEAIEEFPPYETYIDDGQAIWDKPFANGKGYKDCFEKPGIYGDYPRWDAEKGMVTTLSLEINKCLEANGEKPMKYGNGKIASLLAYMAYESRGVVTNIEVPNDPGAMAAYEDGKEFYFKRRGQLNFSCANCHIQSAGLNIRSEKLSPALGHTSHFPVYRSKWGALGTLHRRFKGCNKQVRAKPFKMQGEEYRNLEYFLTHMSNGIVLNGPGARN